MAAIHKAAHPDEDLPPELEIAAASAALDAEPADLESYLSEAVEAVETVEAVAASEPAPEPESAPEPVPEPESAPEPEPVSAAPARPRRRRAASRPAGPPVTDGEGEAAAQSGG
jgi:hypothetical protein